MDDFYLPDHVIAKLLPEIYERISRIKYEGVLAANECYTYSELRDVSYYRDMNKGELITNTLREKGSYTLLNALAKEGALSDEAKMILMNVGISVGQSVTGEIASPVKELSLLEIKLAQHGFHEVMRYLEQSLDCYVRNDFEVSNAMSRTALEKIIQLTADMIAQSRGGEAIL